MSGKMDETKGKLKQAAGALTDDDTLVDEGRNDERAGKAKDAIDGVKDRLDDAVDAVKDRFNDKNKNG